MTVTLRPPRGEEPSILVGPDGEVHRQVPTWEPSASELQSFVGTYHSPELDTKYRFETEGDSLVLRHRKLDDRTVEPAFEDAFSMGGRTLLFERDARGQVTGFRIHAGRVTDLEFVRVEGESREGW